MNSSSVKISSFLPLKFEKSIASSVPIGRTKPILAKLLPEIVSLELMNMHWVKGERKHFDNF